MKSNVQDLSSFSVVGNVFDPAENETSLGIKFFHVEKHFGARLAR
jgi:hypothetical protein